jgi:CRP/FNR family transcriptional regulator, cyclic AMP receptor protein
MPAGHAALKCFTPRWEAGTVRWNLLPHIDAWVAMTALLDVAPFKGMDPAELDRIEAKCRMLEPRDGTSVFSEGDAADAAYAIIAGTGHVRIGTLDRSSKGLLFEVFRAGDIFGEMGILDGSPRSADAVVEGRVRLLRIGSQVFLDALHGNAELGANLCHIFAMRLRRTSILFRDATFETLEVRLAKQLLYLARREGRDTVQGRQLAGRLRQGDLADLLGATTRSIITILNSWRADGLVVYDPVRAQLTICREPELQRLVGADAG